MSIEEIYKSYVDDLYSYALYMGVEKTSAMDVIHDVIYKLMLKESQVNKIDNMRSYLIRAVRNCIVDMYSHNKRFRGRSLVSGKEIPFYLKIDVEEVLIEEEERKILSKKIENMILRLSHRQKEIIYLRFTQNCSHDEIAEIMNISIPAARNLLFRTLKVLRKDYRSLLFLLLFPN